MKLYHGTTETIARAALERGLSPRADTGVASVWKEMPSRDDMVYLSASYALYFAMAAVGSDEKCGIVEVDTDLMESSLLHPDEDFLEQATRDRTDLAPSFLDMEGRTAWYRDNLESFQPHWDLSIKGLGNCAYLGQIVPAEITRVAIFDPTKAPSIAFMALDPMISLINYHFMSTKYRALMSWLFGEVVRLSDFDPMFGVLQWPAEHADSDLVKHIQERQQAFEGMLRDRSAIEILERTVV